MMDTDKNILLLFAAMDMTNSLQLIAGFFPIFLFSLCFHEFAHGLVAKWRGDNTAEMMGRLTMNPFAHADLLGTVIFPIMGVFTGFFFGWAKPVPINERNLKNPKTDLFWIASAGPLSNFLLSFLMAMLLGITGRFFYGMPMERTIYRLGGLFIQTNLFLGTFNALPIHPLDGGKILARFIPDQWDRWLLDNQFLLFICLMVLLNSPLRHFLNFPVEVMYSMLTGLIGRLNG